MIPLFHTAVTAAERDAIASVLDSGKFVMGKHVETLEAELQAYFGEGHFVTCASGTDALVLAMETMNAKMGVIVPAMTFSATYEAVLRARLQPVLVDVDDQTLTPSLDMVRDAIVTSMVRGVGVSCVIGVNLYGWPMHELAEIANFCKSQNMIFIEDCAQSFGAKLHDKMVGTWGDAAAFSFYPTKPLGGIGDGGAVWFREEGKARQARLRRDHGREKGVQLIAGYNSRLDEINCAVLIERLRSHNDNMNKRRAISGAYHAHGMKKLSFKRTGKGIPYVYPILVDKEHREDIKFKLAEIGVETRVHYNPPLSGLPYVNVECPNAKWAARRVLSLPCHQGMTEEDVNRISDVVRFPAGTPL